MRKLLIIPAILCATAATAQTLPPPPVLRVPQYQPPQVVYTPPPANPGATAITAPILQPSGARPITQQSCIYVAQTNRMLCRNL